MNFIWSCSSGSSWERLGIYRPGAAGPGLVAAALRSMLLLAAYRAAVRRSS